MSPRKRYKPQRRLRPKRSRIKPLLKSKLFWFSILGISFCIAIIYGLLFSPFFKISHIQIVGNEKIAAEDVLQIAEPSISRPVLFFSVNNFFLLQKTELAKEVAQAFPQAETVIVQKKLPNEVSIEILERKGIATWCQEKQLSVSGEGQGETSRLFSQCFSVDKHGVIFEKINPGNETTFSAERDKASLGQQVVEPAVLEYMREFQRTLDASSLFQQVGLRVLSVNLISREQAHAAISEGWKIYFNPQDNLEWQVQKAKLVLEKEVSSQERPFLNYLDLRFGDQVYIKYRN